MVLNHPARGAMWPRELRVLQSLPTFRRGLALPLALRPICRGALRGQELPVRNGSYYSSRWAVSQAGCASGLLPQIIQDQLGGTLQRLKDADALGRAGLKRGCVAGIQGRLQFLDGDDVGQVSLVVL